MRNSFKVHRANSSFGGFLFERELSLYCPRDVCILGRLLPTSQIGQLEQEAVEGFYENFKQKRTNAIKRSANSKEDVKGRRATNIVEPQYSSLPASS